MQTTTDSGVTEATRRAPTSDLGAERAVLGILLNDQTVTEQAVDGLEPADFYNPRHAELYKLILETYAAGTPTGPVAIAGILADRGQLQRLAPGTFLTDCVAEAPPSAQLGYYMRRVGDMAERRDWEAKGVQLVQAANAVGHNVTDLAALAESLVAKAQPRRRVLEMTELGSLVNPGLDDIEERSKRPAGITTGFADLDRLLGGLRRKQLVTIAGATGMGKTITLVDIARHISIKLRLKVAFFSLEMSKEEMFERVLSAESTVPHHLIRDGKLDENDWCRVFAKIGPMSNAPLFLSDRAPMRVRDIEQCCRQMLRGPGLDVVVVDHMHLVSPSDSRLIDQTAIVADVSRGLKQLGMSLDVPVLAAAQLNRNPSSRPDKTPQLTDLKGSSSIEQDSNVVILVHRPDYYDPDSPRRGEADLVVAKNRNGSQGVVTVASQLHLSRFVDMAIV